METIDFKEELLTQKQKDNNVLIKKLPDLDDLEIYPRSVQEYLDEIFFIAKTKTQKFLYKYKNF